MPVPITIRLASARDFEPSPDFMELLRILEDPRAHRDEVLKVAGEQGISYAKATELVEDTLEATIGRRRYKESGYAGARVAAHRIAKRYRCKTETNQLDLFQN